MEKIVNFAIEIIILFLFLFFVFPIIFLCFVVYSPLGCSKNDYLILTTVSGFFSVLLIFGLTYSFKKEYGKWLPDKVDIKRKYSKHDIEKIRKKFLRPNWKEIVSSAVFGMLLPFVTNLYQTYNQLKNKQYGCSGFPLNWLCTYKISVLGLDMIEPTFNALNYFVDFIFWYVISYFILFIHKKISGKYSE